MGINETLRAPRAAYSLGAPMGRTVERSATGGDVKPDARWTLQRVRLNSGGYDTGGAYWGRGAPLWHAAAECEENNYAEAYFRAEDRAAAKAHIRQANPQARFYR